MVKVASTLTRRIEEKLNIEINAPSIDLPDADAEQVERILTKMSHCNMKRLKEELFRRGWNFNGSSYKYQKKEMMGVLAFLLRKFGSNATKTDIE